MINLLPEETREDYRYARRNRQLAHWLSAFGVALALLGIIATYGVLSIQQQSNGYNSQVEASKQILKQNHLDETNAQIKDISTSFSLVVNVLGREVLFSKLLQQITSVIPSGVVLSGLNIDQGNGGITLDARARSYAAATQLQVNLTDPRNQIFAKADIENIGCSGSATYPCTVTIQALFGPNNPFLFINAKGTTK